MPSNLPLGHLTDPAGPVGSLCRFMATVRSMSDAPTAIANLLYRYAELMDAGHLDECADLFVDAQVLLGNRTDGKPPVVDRDGLAAVWRSMVRLHEDGTPRTRHLVANPIIEVADDGTTATCRSTYTVFQQVGAGPLQPIITGRYHDRFESGNGTWRFSERVYLMDLTGDLSSHLMGSLPGDVGG